MDKTECGTTEWMVDNSGAESDSTFQWFGRDVGSRCKPT